MRRGTQVWLFLAALVLLFVVWFGTRPISDTTFHLAPGVVVAFSELARGDQSKVTTRENYLVTTPEQFTRLWGLLNVTTPMPAVNFDENDVIAVFAGQEPAAGYEITVTKVADGDTRMVTVLLSSSGPSCSAAHVVTMPYQVLLLPKTSLTLTHEDIATTTSCWQ